MRVDKDTPVNKSQFAQYIGRSRNTASKYYKTYLEMVGKRAWASLTVGDIAKCDDLTVQTVIVRIWN